MEAAEHKHHFLCKALLHLCTINILLFLKSSAVVAIKYGGPEGQSSMAFQTMERVGQHLFVIGQEPIVCLHMMSTYHCHVGETAEHAVFN